LKQSSLVDNKQTVASAERQSPFDRVAFWINHADPSLFCDFAFGTKFKKVVKVVVVVAAGKQSDVVVDGEGSASCNWNF